MTHSAITTAPKMPPITDMMMIQTASASPLPPLEEDLLPLVTGGAVEAVVEAVLEEVVAEPVVEAVDALEDVEVVTKLPVVDVVEGVVV